jgi:sulfhydrogenase subunit beta (sulfur reductase)
MPARSTEHKTRSSEMDLEKIIRKKDLPKFLERLKKQSIVIGPARKGGGTSRYSQATFMTINGVEDLVIDYESSMISPKTILFPDNQNLYAYEKKDEGISLKDLADIWEEERILFGLHPCDITALLRLDKVLMEGGIEDQSYQARREHTTIVGVTCKGVKQSCFCNIVNAGPDLDAGYDILMTDLGDRYFCKARSNKGKKLVSEEYFSDAGEEDRLKRRTELDKIRDALPDELDLGRVCEAMPDSYDNHLWDEFSDRCLTCGACNMVCPTCHCFTIIDKVNWDRSKGTRVLVWDSCHFERFARMSGDLNIREKKTSRFKHRLYDKFYYDLRRSGAVFCVGCGRCLEFCPSHIDIREALRKLAEVRK